MEFWLQQNSDKFQLPVKPSDYTVSVSHKNTVVNVIQVGDVNLIGNTGLREISLKSFFPAKDYNFSNNAGRKQPLTYVEKIESWRKSGTPIRVIITSTLNMEATVESFVWGEQDATGDIYYTSGFDGFEIETQEIYEKDEYIQLMAEKNSSLEEQATDLQLALADVYEQMLGLSAN